MGHLLPKVKVSKRAGVAKRAKGASTPPLRAILIGAAPVDRAWLKSALGGLDVRANDLRIAVDGGIDHWVGLGLAPHFAVGDWDSLGQATQNTRVSRALRAQLVDLPHLTLPKQKDRSDLAHAIDVALNLGATEIVVLAVTGGRPDHHLASLGELLLADHRGLQVTALGPEAEYLILSKNRKLWKSHAPVSRGETLSLFGLSTAARGVKSTGLKYPLNPKTSGKALNWSSFGLSNEGLGKPVEVSIQSGQLMLVRVRVKG